MGLRDRMVALLILCSVIATGCSAGSTPTAKGGGAKGGSLDFDDAASVSARAGQRDGVELAAEHAGVTFGLLALPGCFAPGTQVELTPLKDDSGLPGKGLGPAFRVRADKNAQPKLPVLLVFDAGQGLPHRAVVVSYGDDGSVIEALPTSLSRDGRRTTVRAQVDHFTIFRLEDGTSVPLPSPGAGDARPKGRPRRAWKKWSIRVNGAPERLAHTENDVWDFRYTMRMDASNHSGDIAGPYEGNATIKLKGSLKRDAGSPVSRIPSFIKAKGTIDAGGSGLVDFDLQRFHKWKWDKTKTQRKPGDPPVDLAAWFTGTGQAKLFGLGSLDVSVVAPNAAARAAEEAGNTTIGETRRVHVLVTSMGPHVEVEGIGVWRGILVGVPAAP